MSKEDRDPLFFRDRSPAPPEAFEGEWEEEEPLPEPDPRLSPGTPLPAYLAQAEGRLAWPEPPPGSTPDEESPAGAGSRRAIPVDAGVA